ncbi:hypothetical protein Fmac_006146 [Flemingia macrophylla]|uniref:Isopenicillin N synthase-like Fe(2+) 2OG dioxygenase domain-containing protein n=1 Tax=Flemingia macrophylla TaxID=520843 RepID=A0ABD1N9T8_9FABA
MGEVDAAFVQDPEHKLKLSPIQVEGIPIIDLSPITNHTTSDLSAIDCLVKECYKTINGKESKSSAIIEEYIEEMEKPCFKLLELIATSLSIEAKRFEEFSMKDESSYIRLNHYPPCPYLPVALGVGKRQDPGALTILAQDEVGGLEVWSNDAYESVEHRMVVNSEKERFSIPFFFPAQETEVKPLEELIMSKTLQNLGHINGASFFSTE